MEKMNKILAFNKKNKREESDSRGGGEVRRE